MTDLLAAPHPNVSFATMAAAISRAATADPKSFSGPGTPLLEAKWCEGTAVDPPDKGFNPFEIRQIKCEALIYNLAVAYFVVGGDSAYYAAALSAYNHVSRLKIGYATGQQPANSAAVWKHSLDAYLKGLGF